MKKKIVIGIGGIAVLLCIAVFFLFSGAKLDMKINSEKIDADEYLYVMNQQVYDVVQELTQGKKQQVHEEFWTTEADGQMPYQLLADRTIEKLRYNRAVYENAKEQGYVNAIDYKQIVERMKEENRNRAEKMKAGEPVYGLSEFTIELFMEYEMDTFQKQYCENPDNEGMQISEDERKQYYEAQKDVLFLKEDDVVFDYIKIEYEWGGMQEERVLELKERLTDLYRNMNRENGLKSLAEQDELLKPYVKHEEILSSEVNLRAREIGDVIEYGYELKAGESTQVLDESGILYLIQCVDRKEYEYQLLEEVRDNIDKKLREQHYNQLIEKKAEEAEVTADMKKVYEFTKKSIKK